MSAIISATSLACFVLSGLATLYLEAASIPARMYLYLFPYNVDIDPFGEHESRTEEPTDQNISLDPVTPGGRSTWEPTHQQETSFGGRESQRNRVLIDRVKGLYSKLSQKLPRTSEVFHYNLFELRNSKLYFRDKSTPLTTKKGG